MITAHKVIGLSFHNVVYFTLLCGKRYNGIADYLKFIFQALRLYQNLVAPPKWNKVA